MNHRRRAAAVLTVLLACSVLPVLGSAPATASPGCLEDVPVTPFTLDGCDDTTPPQTAIGATAPRVNASGWINKGTIRVGITGTHTDADTDPIALECVLTLEATAPDAEDWSACPAGGLFTDLAETASKPYSLWARAVDSADQSTLYVDMDPFNGDDEPTDDRDASPARLVFRVDTLVPDSYIFGTPYDELTPELPMVTDRRPSFRLAATESAAFRCTVDGDPVPCSVGSTRLRSLDPGDHALRVQAVDPAGNADPSPATTRFAVPTNLVAKGGGWSRTTRGGYLGGDYLSATRRGAQLTVKARGYREVRLLAATGPTAGVIEMRLGGVWKRVSLKRGTATKLDQIQVLDQFSPRRRGPIVIRVVSSGKRVQLDGVLVH